MLRAGFDRSATDVFRSRSPGPDAPTSDEPTPDWLDQLQTALVHLDEGSRVLGMNASAEDLLAVSAARAPTDPLLAQALRDSGLADLAERAGIEQRGLAAQDLRWRLPGGARWLDARATRLAGRGVLLELQDAGPRRRAMVDRSRAARRALSKQVVQQLAHEIRNPLAGLRGAAQLLARSELDEAGRELADIVCHETDRLEALVEDLLGTGRSLEPTPANVHAPLDRVVQLLTAELEQSIELKRDFDPSLPHVAIDDHRMQQVFLNLARNAVEAGASELVFRTRAAPGVTLAGRPCRLAVAIEVEDDGPGVPESLLDALFFPLVSGRPDGTGLGLSIAQDLVDRHFGEIDHERRHDRTVFRVLLPVPDGSLPVVDRPIE